MLKRLPPLAAACAIAALLSPADAQEPPERAETLVVYGADPCPRSSGDEDIVVCARRPESERYRIPKNLREDKDARPSQVGWGARVQALEDEARLAGPTGCSVIGPGGNAGCQAKFVDDWYEERRSRRSRR